MSEMTCPLCGRDMTAIETHPGRGELYCGHCDLTIGGNEAKTPDELMALLEQRTCHLEEYEQEREIPYDLPDCDGGWYTEVTHDCDECGYENIDPNVRFCGGCGRRVVRE